MHWRGSAKDQKCGFPPLTTYYCARSGFGSTIFHLAGSFQITINTLDTLKCIYLLPKCDLHRQNGQMAKWPSNAHFGAIFLAHVFSIDDISNCSETSDAIFSIAKRWSNHIDDY